LCDLNSATITPLKFNRLILLSQATQQLKSFLILFSSNRKTTLFLSFVLLLLFAWFLGQLVAQSLDGSSKSVLQVKESVFNASSAQGKASYLFGKPDKTVTKIKKKPKAKMKEVKTTRLNLTLVGIIYMGDRSLALIKRNNKTQVVFEGEEILANVVLLEIYPEEIVISNRGVQERLSLVGGKNKLLTKETRTETTTESTIESNDGANQAMNRSNLSQENNGALNEIGRSLKKSPMSIAKFIKFKPINKNGNWAGVKIWSKSDEKLFRAVGFKEGDMLVNVNGRSINELASNPRLWQEFLKENQFELIVERNGQEHNISVDLSGS